MKQTRSRSPARFSMRFGRLPLLLGLLGLPVVPGPPVTAAAGGPGLHARLAFQDAAEPGAVDPTLAGPWRVLSARLFYDAGGGGSVRTAGPELLLGADGTFTYGDTTGTWAVSAIADEDWARWQVSPYGPTRKINFAGWQPGGMADGPIEEAGGRIDFVWAIYRAEPPLVGGPGIVQIKFGVG